MQLAKTMTVRVVPRARLTTMPAANSSSNTSAPSAPHQAGTPGRTATATATASSAAGSNTATGAASTAGTPKACTACRDPARSASLAQPRDNKNQSKQHPRNHYRNSHKLPCNSSGCRPPQSPRPRPSRWCIKWPSHVSPDLTGDSPLLSISLNSIFLPHIGLGCSPVCGEEQAPPRGRARRRPAHRERRGRVRQRPKPQRARWWSMNQPSLVRSSWYPPIGSASEFERQRAELTAWNCFTCRDVVVAARNC